MKKITNSCLFIATIICLITGCQTPKLQLKQEDFTIELGNPIQKQVQYYINTENLSEKQIQDILLNAKLTIDSQDKDLIHKYNLSYEKVGTYHAIITYYKQTLEFDIIVKDTRSPTISGTTFDDLKIIDYNDIEEISIEGDRVYVQDVVGNEAYKTMNQPFAEKVYLDVPYYNQIENNAPNGCETTSLYMALKYMNKIDTDLQSFIKNEPYDKNPYYGFAGNPFQKAQKKDDYYTIFPTPLAQYGSQYTPCFDISYSSLTDIKYYLSQDNPVIVWATGYFKDPCMKTLYFGEVTSNLHIVLICGYDDDQEVFYIKDPAVEDLTEISYEQFDKVYNSMKFAVVVSK